MEMSRDAGSIPAASTKGSLREIVNCLFLWTYGDSLAFEGHLNVGCVR